MTVWAIVPVKPLGRGKSRLSNVLSAEDRLEMNRSMLEHTLQVLNSVPKVARVLVISRDLAALALARDYNARTVQETGESDLNTALQRATLFARQYTLRGVLILPADLPLLAKDDIETVLRNEPGPPAVVVVPDRHRRGTNALLVVPPGLIEYEFGENSYQKHCTSARRKGAHLVELEIPSLALDLDLPQDLRQVEKELGTPAFWKNKGSGEVSPTAGGLPGDVHVLRKNGKEMG